MNSRRELLASLGALTLAGCTAQGGSEPGQNESTDDDESENNDDELQGDPTAGQLHDHFIGDVPSEIDQDALLQTYVEARQENGIIHGIGQTLQAASQQLEDYDGNYQERHNNILAAVDSILSDQHQLYSLHSKAYSTTHDDTEFDTSKVWLEGHENVDINAALTPDTEHAVHIENTQPEGPHEDALKEFRNPEKPGNAPEHDKEALENLIEHYREHRDREYSEEDLKEGYGSRLENLDGHIWGDGMAVPVEGEWNDYHENMETLLPELNVQYHNSENIERGETAAFTVENGEIEVYQTPEGYDPATDGPLTQEEIR